MGPAEVQKPPEVLRCGCDEFRALLGSSSPGLVESIPRRGNTVKSGLTGDQRV